jgi:hypothetical protein
MNSLLKKVGSAALGVVMMIGYWTFVGPGSDNTESADAIPATVWGGGAGTMQIEIDSTSAAQMRMSFNERNDADDAKSLETYENVPPGFRVWTVDLPANTGGYVELGAVEPKAGDKLSMKVRVNDKLVYEESSTLEEELKPNYAFFTQAYFEDYSTGELSND